ncbi:MAG: glycoside hydrolase family 140 protein [Opitutaceae bacterium]|nr:glycoside hydrolase family 140 protein [Opitutaceae bacterium]
MLSADTGATGRATATPRAALPRVRVHPDGHYLQLGDGRPFFWLGDTAWLIMHRATREEASYYLHARARQGFNVIQVSLLPETDGLRTPSAWGELPFEGIDPLKPREAYFRLVDDFFTEAASLGLYVAVIACWGDKMTAPWGDGPRIFTTGNLPVARQYGRWLGTRYVAHTNVLWFMGGDRPPRLGGHPSNWSESTGVQAGFPKDHDWTPIWREMATGLLEGTQGQALISYHPQGGAATTSVYLHHEPWLMLNSMQSGHGGGHDQPVWAWIERDFALTPAKPTFDSEPNYEDHPVSPWPRWDPAVGYFRDLDVRKQCWRSVFAGGCGVTYGHHAIWHWCGDRYDAINHADRDWRDALTRPGACQVRHLRDLLESRPFFTRVADQAMILSGAGEGGGHIRATRDAAGTWAALYVPRSDQRVRVDLAVLRAASRVRAWWFDPRNGLGRLIGELPTSTPAEFTSPSFGPDWVLVLDDLAAAFAPPGLRPA